MNKQLHSFYIALSFLTRIPSPLKGDISQTDISQSVLYYPLVGAIIGLILYLFNHFILFFSSDLSHDLLAAILLTVWVLVTGGLHLDGLADSADAWIGGQNDRERTLTIMKDTHCGPIGVVIIILLLLLKWTALSYLLKNGQSAFLIVIPMLSRSVVPALFMTTTYVRESGLGSAFLEEMPEDRYLWLSLSISAVVYWIFASIFSLLLVILAVMGLRAIMNKRIGGMTGDTIGATVEIAEMVALLALVM